MKPENMGKETEIMMLQQQLVDWEQELRQGQKKLAAIKMELKQCREQSQNGVIDQLQPVHRHESVASTSVCVCLCGPLQMSNDSDDFICSFYTECS